MDADVSTPTKNYKDHTNYDTKLTSKFLSFKTW